MSKRIERTNKLLKEEINKILLREFDFENILVTIVSVETAPNLSYANIKISIIPEKEETKVLKILENNVYNIQKILNKKLNMKPVPKIHFEIDRGIKKLHKIDEILGKIQNERNN